MRLKISIPSFPWFSTIWCSMYFIFCTFPTDRKAIKTFFSPKDWIPWGKVYMQYVMPGFICDNAKWLIFSVYWHINSVLCQTNVGWIHQKCKSWWNSNYWRHSDSPLHNPPRRLRFSSQWYCESVSNRVEWFFICHLRIQIYDFY